MLTTLMAFGIYAAASPTQILSPEKLAEYRAIAPHVAAPEIEKVIQDDATMWYDREVMIPSYQDTVGDGDELPIGARANNAGKAIIVPEGKKFFSDDGQTWSFPFGFTAGTDNSDNVAVADFIRLPTVNGKMQPIVYQITDDPEWSGIGLHRWTWKYPKGTVVGELIFVKDSAGKLFPVELRTRTRGDTDWATNVFRPFPTATSLAAAVKHARPNWQQVPALKQLVDSLADTSGLTKKTVSSPGFNNIVTLDGYIDQLPPFGDDDLVRQLLTKTTFVSAYDTAWKKDGDKVAYAASTTAAFSIVPRNYFASLIAPNDESCSRCHQNSDKMLEDFEEQTVLYGDMWGMDKIFSFHPWDQSRYEIFNNDNREVRPEFVSSGMVQPASH